MLNLILRSQTSMQKENCKKQEKCVVIAFFFGSKYCILCMDDLTFKYHQTQMIYGLDCNMQI